MTIDLHALIKSLADTPNEQLSAPLALQCRTFAQRTTTADQQLRFVRNLRDLASEKDAASSMMLALLASACSTPESPSDRDQRQAQLKATQNASS